MRLIFLDTGPLGLLCHHAARPHAVACKAWAANLLVAGVRVVIPGIADYEVRRELIRAGKTAGLRRLDAAKDGFEFDPVTQAAIDRAAVMWAEVRNAGLTTAADAALDADCILAAQALLATRRADVVTVATSNVRHLSRFVDAQPWESITS